MKVLDSINSFSIPTTCTETQILTASGMPANKAVDRFWLRFLLTFVRGGGAAIHVSQAISQIVSRILISHGRMNWNVRGLIVQLFDSLSRLTINSQNPVLQIADTSYEFWFPIDPAPIGPPYAKNNAFRTEELQDMEINFNLINPFLAADITTLVASTVQLWGAFKPVEKGGKPWTSIFKEQGTFPGTVFSINDVAPSIVVGTGVSPTNFGQVSISAPSENLATFATSLGLDAKDSYRQTLNPGDAELITSGGNQFLRDIPNAQGAPSNFTKLFDVRNNPETSLPLVFDFNEVPVPFGYAVKGYGV